MLALIEAAGWPIWPLLIASVIALAIVIERFWTLRSREICPTDLLDRVVKAYRQHGIKPGHLDELSRTSPLGRILATGLKHSASSREVIKEAIEETGRSVGHQLERFLTTLGTIATISPLLGLLGTVIGMVEIFGSQDPTGNNPAALAHGISVALYNTAFGLIVAIPSLIFHRHFRAQVDMLLVEMEQQAIKLVEIIHGERKES